MDYRDTVHLPKTGFPMRAALSGARARAGEGLGGRQDYQQLLLKNASSKKFVFHDGPPYANGAIHQGHFLNKILKDLVVKYHLMAGHLTDFVPGWDCHGLPIERQVDKLLGPKKRELSIGQFRRACRKYAEEQIDLQREDFKRLGIFARWDHPYETMDFRYEADIVRQLATLARRGALYRRKRPVHWCFHDVTALAEAEVEYARPDQPLHLRALPGRLGRASGLGARHLDHHAVDDSGEPGDHRQPRAGVRRLRSPRPRRDRGGEGSAARVPPGLCACGARRPGQARGEDLPSAARATGSTLRHPERIRKTLQGSELAAWKYRHPLVDRESPVILGAHATADAGTGLVHTAPGHGEDDYDMGVQYGLPDLDAGRQPWPLHRRRRHRRTRRIEGLRREPEGDRDARLRRRPAQRGRKATDPPQLPALLAVPEPGDLPRHRSVVDRPRSGGGASRPRPHHHPQGGARLHRRDRRERRLRSRVGARSHLTA